MDFGGPGNSEKRFGTNRLMLQDICLFSQLVFQRCCKISSRLLPQKGSQSNILKVGNTKARKIQASQAFYILTLEGPIIIPRGQYLDLTSGKFPPHIQTAPFVSTSHLCKLTKQLRFYNNRCKLLASWLLAVFANFTILPS